MSADDTPLADGLVLRAGRDEDRDDIVALNVAAHGASEAGAVRHLLKRPEQWAVVVDPDRGDRVVSTCVLLEHEARYGSVPFALGQIEYVATDPDYRRRGLVRAQFDALHARSAALGQLMTLVTGIPYFYRRLGYQYGLQYPRRYRLVDRLLADTGPWIVGPATADDIDDLERLHAQGHQAADLVALRPRADWEWLVRDAAGHGEELFVARREGRVEGFGRVQRYPDSVMERAEMYEAAADSVGAARALLVYARDGARGDAGGSDPPRHLGHGPDLAIVDRPGTPFSVALRASGEPSQDYLAIYTRIPDPVAFLRHVRPVLAQRLAGSPFAGECGSVVVSLYDRSITIAYERGAVGAIEWGPAIEDPFEEGHAGVAPDALDALVLGRFGAAGLDALVDDVMLGRDLPLLDVLFPPMRADVPMTI